MRALNIEHDWNIMHDQSGCLHRRRWYSIRSSNIMGHSTYYVLRISNCTQETSTNSPAIHAGRELNLFPSVPLSIHGEGEGGEVSLFLMYTIFIVRDILYCAPENAHKVKEQG